MERSDTRRRITLESADGCLQSNDDPSRCDPIVATPAGVLADKGGKGKGGDPQGPPGQWVDDGKPGKGNKGAKGGKPAHDAVGILISSDEHRVIHDYFRLNPYPAQGLPPGIAKNLARGKPLPPGIAKRYLPPGLLGRLPARPGYEWVARYFGKASWLRRTGIYYK